MGRPGQKKNEFLKILAFIIVAFIAYRYFIGTDFWKSRFNQDTSDQTTSTGHSYAKLASLAVFTYGFDCDKVVSHGEMGNYGYYNITCSSGVVLQVHPRGDDPPEISDSSGN